MAMGLNLANTHQIVAKLKHSGFTDQQAATLTEVIQEIDVSQLATKNDLKVALAEQTTSLLKWLIALLIAQTALLVALVELVT